jgi:hypothetical protein
MQPEVYDDYPYSCAPTPDFLCDVSPTHVSLTPYLQLQNERFLLIDMPFEEFQFIITVAKFLYYFQFWYMDKVRFKILRSIYLRIESIQHPFSDFMLHLSNSIFRLSLLEFHLCMHIVDHLTKRLDFFILLLLLMREVLLNCQNLRMELFLLIIVAMLL